MVPASLGAMTVVSDKPKKVTLTLTGPHYSSNTQTKDFEQTSQELNGVTTSYKKP